MTNSSTEKEGGAAGWIGRAAAKCGPAARLLVFLVGAALLALVGLVAEAGVVETQAVVAAALGRPGGGRAAAAGLVADGRETAGSGQPQRRRQRPPPGSAPSKARYNAG